MHLSPGPQALGGQRWQRAPPPPWLPACQAALQPGSPRVQIQTVNNCRALVKRLELPVPWFPNLGHGMRVPGSQPCPAGAVRLVLLPSPQSPPLTEMRIPLTVATGTWAWMDLGRLPIPSPSRKEGACASRAAAGEREGDRQGRRRSIQDPTKHTPGRRLRTLPQPHQASPGYQG